MGAESEIVALKRRIVAATGDPLSVQGCSDAEVAEVVAANGSFVPGAHYLHFLRHLGRRAGDAFRGTSVFYPGCLDAHESLAEVFPDEDASTLFLFGHHQGYQFYFFRAGDPRVLMRTELDDGTSDRVVAPSFLRFLDRQVRRRPAAP